MDWKNFLGLGVFRRLKKILFFGYSKKERETLLFSSKLDDTEFEFSEPKLVHLHNGKKNESPDWHSFRVTKIPTGFFLSYKTDRPKPPALHGAFSKDLANWHEIGKLSGIQEIGAVVPNLKYRHRHVMYFGEKDIKIAFSADLSKWQVAKKDLLSPRPGFFDSDRLSVGTVANEKDGILLFYYARDKKTKCYSIATALFNKHDPEHLLWRSEKPLWTEPTSWANKNVVPVGMLEDGPRLISFWEDPKVGIYAVTLKRITYRKRIEGVPIGGPTLVRFHKNPIIIPHPQRKWETKATFNPAAFVADDIVHIIYRAIGENDVSALGYAMSRDGLNIDERLDQPIYVPTESFEGACPENPHKHGAYHDSPYISGGGGWGGCEDPRITEIGDRLYMTYVAYDGFSAPRVALTSIARADFLARNWKWDKPVLISEPGIVNKNACILPEKINGQYVIFHRIFPDILIDFVDDLNFDGETKWLKTKARIKPRPDCWDSRKLGIGGTPIKTSDGWLLIYQGMGGKDGTHSQYKIGAMLLDLKDPTKVLYRTKEAILEPDEDYENNGFKAGVVYPCGAIVKDDNLMVYYGGADSYTCVAYAPIDKFLNDLKSTESPKLTPVTN